MIHHGITVGHGGRRRRGKREGEERALEKKGGWCFLQVREGGWRRECVGREGERV